VDKRGLVGVVALVGEVGVGVVNIVLFLEG
jgi:hypothetical protein